MGGLLVVLAVGLMMGLVAFSKMQAAGYNALGSAALGLGIGLLWVGTLLARALRARR